jgi:hypothetical protein
MEPGSGNCEARGVDEEDQYRRNRFMSEIEFRARKTPGAKPAPGAPGASSRFLAVLGTTITGGQTMCFPAVLVDLDCGDA